MPANHALFSALLNAENLFATGATAKTTAAAATLAAMISGQNGI